jgi:hypothetical protein
MTRSRAVVSDEVEEAGEVGVRAGDAGADEEDVVLLLLLLLLLCRPLDGGVWSEEEEESPLDSFSRLPGREILSNDLRLFITRREMRLKGLLGIFSFMEDIMLIDTHMRLRF